MVDRRVRSDSLAPYLSSQAVAHVPIRATAAYEEEIAMRQYLIALSALTVVAGAPAAAQDFAVKYSDLNLQSAKGQKELERRIDKAAREYCGLDAPRSGTRMHSQGTRDCYRDARAAARQEMAALLDKSQLGG
jgi:UrcA family protein